MEDQLDMLSTCCPPREAELGGTPPQGIQSQAPHLWAVVQLEAGNEKGEGGAGVLFEPELGKREEVRSRRPLGLGIGLLLGSDGLAPGFLALAPEAAHYAEDAEEYHKRGSDDDPSATPPAPSSSAAEAVRRTR